MRFISIYIPSYAHQKALTKAHEQKYWHILLLVLAVHFFVFSLFLIRPLVKAKVSDEIEIDLSTLVAIPKSSVQKTESPRSEQVRSEGSPKVENIKPLAQVQPVETSPAPENTPVVKFNEEIIKPVKVERVQEKPIPVAVIEKPEEKKVQTQNQAPVQAQADPKPAEVIAPMLPAVVDKKNKDKDAPEVAQPAKAAGSSSGAPSESARSTASSPSSTPTQGGSQAQAQSGSQPSSSGNEMQAQLSGSKSPSVMPAGNGGAAGTADADYKSESLRNAQPRYPIYSRKMRQEGVVIISAEVLADGSATDVRVATSSGIKLLDEAALEAVKQWHFIPAKKDGAIYVQRLRIPVVFSLNGK